MWVDRSIGLRAIGIDKSINLRARGVGRSMGLCSIGVNIRGLSKKFVEFLIKNKPTIPMIFKFVYN